MSDTPRDTHRILVVDDEPNIVDVVAMALRYQGFEVASAATGREALEQDLEMDEDTREDTRAGRAIELTATEYRLLRFFLLHPRAVLTRAQLLDNVWDYDFGGHGRVLETYVSYLRKELDVHGPPLIHTARGVGYALRLPRT